MELIADIKILHVNLSMRKLQLRIFVEDKEETKEDEEEENAGEVEIIIMDNKIVDMDKIAEIKILRANSITLLKLILLHSYLNKS